MVLLRRRGLLFIKGGKVAGTSIEVFLSAFAEEDDIVTPIVPPSPAHVPRNFLAAGGEPRFYNHIDAATVRDRLGAPCFDSLTRLGVVREPFEKIRSTFAMQYVRNAGRYDVDRAIADTWSEAEKYCDASGKLLLTDVVRYESLEAGLAAVFERVSIPFERLEVREKADYRASCPVVPAFTRAQADLIRRKFAWEFENFYDAAEVGQ